MIAWNIPFALDPSHQAMETMDVIASASMCSDASTAVACLAFD